MLVVTLQNGIELSKKAMTTGYVKWRTVTLEGTDQWNLSRINLEYLHNILINGFGTKCRTGPMEFGGGKIL